MADSEDLYTDMQVQKEQKYQSQFVKKSRSQTVLAGGKVTRSTTHAGTIGSNRSPRPVRKDLKHSVTLTDFQLPASRGSSEKAFKDIDGNISVWEHDENGLTKTLPRQTLGNVVMSDDKDDYVDTSQQKLSPSPNRSRVMRSQTISTASPTHPSLPPLGESDYTDMNRHHSDQDGMQQLEHQHSQKISATLSTKTKFDDSSLPYRDSDVRSITSRRSTDSFGSSNGGSGGRVNNSVSSLTQTRSTIKHSPTITVSTIEEDIEVADGKVKDDTGDYAAIPPSPALSNVTQTTALPSQPNTPKLEVHNEITVVGRATPRSSIVEVVEETPPIPKYDNIPVEFPVIKSKHSKQDFYRKILYLILMVAILVILTLVAGIIILVLENAQQAGEIKRLKNLSLGTTTTGRQESTITTTYLQQTPTTKTTHQTTTPISSTNSNTTFVSTNSKNISMAATTTKEGEIKTVFSTIIAATTTVSISEKSTTPSTTLISPTNSAFTTDSSTNPKFNATSVTQL